MKRNKNWAIYYKAFKQLEHMKIQIGAVGMHSVEEGQKPISNAAILSIAEVGVPSLGIPARMPVRKGLMENVAYLSKLTRDLLNRNLGKNGYDIQKIGKGLGVAMVQIIKATIMSRLSPALSDKPSGKGYKSRKVAEGYSDIPLIKTQQLKNSIEYGVKS